MYYVSYAGWPVKDYRAICVSGNHTSYAYSPYTCYIYTFNMTMPLFNFFCIQTINYYADTQ